MKRIHRLSSQIILGVLCTIFGLCLMISLAFTVIFANLNLFSNNEKDYGKKLYDEAGYSYAAWALSDRDGDFNSEVFKDWNCNYGIIVDYNTNKGSLNNEGLYLYKNFSGVKVPDDAYVGTFTVGKETVFDLTDNLLNPIGRSSTSKTSSDTYYTYDIEGIGYDLIGQKLYVYADNRFYPIMNGYYSYSDENGEATPNTNSIYEKIWEHNKSTIIKEEAEETEEATADEECEIDPDALFIDGKAYEPLSKSISGYNLKIYCDDGGDGVLDLKNVADLSNIHDELPADEEHISFDSISVVGTWKLNSSYKDYTFVCFPKDDYTGAHDFYAQANTLIFRGDIYRVLLPTLDIVFAILMAVTFILFLIASGHRNAEKEVIVGGTDKFFVDMTTVGAVIVVAILVSVVSEISYAFDSSLIVAATTITIFYLITAFIGLLWSSNVIVNIKAKQLFKNTLCYIVLKWLFKWLKARHGDLKEMRASVKWTYRIWGLFIVFTIFEFLGLVAFDCDDILFVWFLEKILFAVILHFILKGYARIKATTVALAAGDTNAQVEIKGLPLFMEEHADALNKVQSGIVIALEERTKSERMKTELITNVSHDIKTPLTSIINYVDLLGKEDIKNDKAKEYLEVLDRQSKRLKKLIEDLIEASKASTGNIKFNMENVNAVVLLNQSIGEFADRLDAGQISLVTNFPKEDIYLKADNRYLWRVFDNLMSNIVKYAQPNTRAYIDLVQTEGKLQFTFRNTSKEELNISADELMERFVRGDKSRYTDGNGLGLSIARSLTESMGGKMNISIDGDLFKVTIEFDKL